MRSKKRQQVRIRIASPRKKREQVRVSSRLPKRVRTQIGTARKKSGLHEVYAPLSTRVSVMKCDVARAAKLRCSDALVLPSANKWQPSLTKRQLKKERSTLAKLGIESGAQLTLRVRPKSKPSAPSASVQVVVPAKDAQVRVKKANDRCERQTEYLEGVDMKGDDLVKAFVTKDKVACCKACVAKKGCTFWTWGTGHPRGKHCWLKHNKSGQERQANRVSGRIAAH